MEQREQVERCTAFLRAVPVFFELDDAALRALAQHANEERFEPGQVIVAQGDDELDKRFYVIRSGTADVVRGDGGHEQIVGRLVCGSYFGELGLLTNRARNATVRVRGPRDLQVYSFDALAFHEIIADNVLLFRMQRARRDAERSSAGMAGPLRPRMQVRDIELIRTLPDADRDFVMAHSEQRTLPVGVTIFEQGDAGDRFYMVLAGRVRVVRDGVDIATIGPGEFFGETALLLDMPRTASVETVETTTVWSITRGAFQRIVGHRLLANQQTQATIMQRMQSVASQLPPRRPEPEPDER
jgi:cAMP-dependent protein kinase regulator